MDEPTIYAADDAAVRVAAAVLRELRGPTPVVRQPRAMVRPAPLGTPRRSRQAVPRPPVRSRRGG
jgi:hypothetical protein